MSLENFFDDTDKLTTWGSEVEKERRRRILLSIYAYAYEKCDDSLISDGEFDKMCLQVNPKLETDNKKLDDFFKNEFDPSTGQWIHKHPELHKIAELYRKYYC